MSRSTTRKNESTDQVSGKLRVDRSKATALFKSTQAKKSAVPAKKSIDSELQKQLDTVRRVRERHKDMLKALGPE